MWRGASFALLLLTAAACRGELAPSRPPSIVVPERANEAVVASSLRFTLVGARPVTGQWVSGAMHYPDAVAGGDLFVRSSDHGVEDFVSYATRPAEEHLAYAIDVRAVGGVRSISGTIELLDPMGTPTIRMAPPYVVTRDGRRTPIATALSGCAFDTSPAPPWDRPVTPPASSTCLLDLDWELADSEYPAVVDPAWTFATDLVEPRGVHESVALDSGRVLVIGGKRGGGIRFGELYDPKTGTWASTNGTNAAEFWPTITKLTDGKVLIAGGTDFFIQSRYAGAGLYDPAVGAWVPVASLPAGNALPTLTALPGGRAILAGGFLNDDVTKSALFFEPATKTWAPAPPMLTERAAHVAAALPDGRVFVTGGEKCCVGLPFEALNTTEIFDPVGNTWTPGPPLGTARYNHTMSVLPDGRVVVVGGASVFYFGGHLGSVERADAALTGFTPLGDLTFPRCLHRTTPLPNGKLLVTGSVGDSFNAGSVLLAELIDPASGAITGAENNKAYRSAHSADRLPDGRVLVIGGGIATPIRSTEIFGTPLGAPCSTGECLNGVCVDGVCCATSKPCKPVVDAGTDSGSIDSGSIDSGTQDAAPVVPPADAAPPPDEEIVASTSYHACALARAHQPANRALVIAGLALAALVTRKRRSTS